MFGPSRILLLLSAVACAESPSVSLPPERIVLIVVDTLRRDHVGVYGAERATPHIDSLAEDGTVFTDAVASFHSTPTSMGALFTGRTPSLESGRSGRALPWNQHSWCGLARFARDARDACVPASLPTLAERLRELGYWTVGIHSHPLLRSPTGFQRGFQHWRELRGASPHMAFGRRNQPVFAAARAAEHVNEAVFAALDARRSDRFFLYVHYLDVHDWHLAGVPYADAVARADRAVGELLDGLERRGLRLGSVIVLTSDHGESLGEQHFQTPRARHAGNPSFETVLRVPLVVGGLALDGSERLTRSEDVFRLIVALAGGEAPPSELAPGEQLVTENRDRLYRQGRWKSFWPRGPGPARLVDLVADPEERHDVAAEHPDVLAAHAERVETLSARLAAQAPVPEEVDPQQREHLRALGYLEPAYDLDAPAEAP